MITAELSHNPYLLLTKVKYNGQSPKINSQIEKYEGKPLKDWVRYVPEIFYNEMNGYDFDLFFSGTRPDYDAVKQAFHEVGVGEDQVRIYHKNEIEDATIKSEEILSLLSWIKSHPNKRFDYEHFWEENSELFEDRYPLVVFYGNISEQIHPSISLQTIDSADILANSNITNMPIVFQISEESRNQFRKDLKTVLEKKELSHSQLFFMIDPAMDKKQIIRVISDMGVRLPRVVESYSDDKIISYIRDYPMTDYVRSFLELFKSFLRAITKGLDKDNEESLVVNKTAHMQIEQIESDLTVLKETDEYFVQRDNYVVPYTFNDGKAQLMDNIQKWKSKKMKITGVEEAETAAANYSAYLHKEFNSFAKSVEGIYFEAGRKIETDFSKRYAKSGIDTDYVPQDAWLALISHEECPDIREEFLKLKEVKYEEHKDLLDFLKMTESSTTMVSVVTCDLKKWRSLAEDSLLPYVNRMIHACSEDLQAYYNELAEVYHEHLLRLIADKTAEKEEVTLRLSEDERKLQEDNDWITEIRDQLTKIERG